MGNIRELSTRSDLDQLIEDSDHQLILLFKHSSRCPTSAIALRHLQEFSTSSEAVSLAFGIIHVIENRSLSDLVTNQFGIRHQSPQLLLISQKRVLWHGSHSEITKERIAEAVNQSVTTL